MSSWKVDQITILKTVWENLLFAKVLVRNHQMSTIGHTLLSYLSRLGWDVTIIITTLYKLHYRPSTQT